MKKVIVRHQFDIEEEWEDKYATKDHIEFYYNEGTSCANNIVEKIMKLRKDGECLCRFQTSTVLQIK